MNEEQESRQPGFTDFLLAEYSNIAKAHFATMESISAFFKHYLVIMSIPITALVILFNLIGTSKQQLSQLVQFSWFLTLLFFVIALVGMFVMLYLVNLRFDTLLYARCINGIRKYFYDRSSLNAAEQAQLRVLPQSRYTPPYRERYFWPVVLSFGLLDSLYCYIGTLLFLVSLKLVDPGNLLLSNLINLRLLLPSFIFLIFCHIFPYICLAYKREQGYLSSNIIGVDIDGVLNKHREHFCTILAAHNSMVISPDSLDVLPVRYCKGINITKDDETTVFNDPVYWTQMPPMEEASEILKKLHNSLNLKVFIFTARSWPLVAKLSKGAKYLTQLTWEHQSKQETMEMRKTTSKRGYLKSSWSMFWKELPSPLFTPRSWFRTRNIDRITKVWLAKNDFIYDRIMIEKGNEDVIEPHAHIHNRFQIARSSQIRFFVEDDLNKAIKLAYMCDFVFLIDQPYNQADIPAVANIIRVKSWGEIYNIMKELL